MLMGTFFRIRIATDDEAGDYYVRVSGADDAVQIYNLSVNVGDRPSGPRLVSVNPNDGGIFDPDIVNVLHVSPRDLTFRFDG